MKFKSLKFIAGIVIAFVICSLMAACTMNRKLIPQKHRRMKIRHLNQWPPLLQTSDAATAKKKTGKASMGITVNTDANTKIEKDKMGYYNRTEVLPAYKGGQSALETYINNNIEYPQDAIDNNTEGTVNVQFAVDEQGNISNVKTIGNKIGYGLEEEAIKVVSKMPQWTAGQVKGKNVKTWRILPITYKLES